MKNFTVSRHRGFTLVEMLVVIGVLAVLAALALPVLNKASESGRAAKSIANLTAIGKAILLYAGENSMRLPTLTDRVPWQKLYWTDQIKPYIGDRTYNLSNNQDLWYRPKIYENPYYTKASQHQITGDYGANRNVIAYMDGNNPWFPSSAVTLMQIPKQGETVMVTNCGRSPQNANGPGGTWYMDTPNFLAAPGLKDGHPQPIFNNVIHALFVDGHVESIPYDTFVEKRTAYLGAQPFNK
jgi:prepilin-type N-terminal cleavage/methylation domain-containing protein/prepilin-type processing-associated H-X9-DG protein